MRNFESFTLWIDPVDLQVLRRLSKETGVPMCALIRDWIDRGLYGESDNPEWSDVRDQRNRRKQRNDIADKVRATLDQDVEAIGSGS